VRYLRRADEGERVMAARQDGAPRSLLTLFDTAPRFDGVTFDPVFDQDRLSRQLGRVFEFMSDQQWHTLDEIQAFAGGRESAVSARLRDLRKAKFGAYTVPRRRRGAGGTFEYRLLGAKVA
jgi:hypothetical protein